MRNAYAIDGRCHNAEPGTFNHECGRPAAWLGTNAKGFTSGYCDECRQHGYEARKVVQWHPAPYGPHLPLLPMLYATPDRPLTEERIERAVGRLMDKADEVLLSGLCTQGQYDAWTRHLNEWAEEHYGKLRAARAA
jgi:hypothetical protein